MMRVPDFQNIPQASAYGRTSRITIESVPTVPREDSDQMTEKPARRFGEVHSFH
jgi:hypothetical protein